MALYHFSASVVKRSAGRSAVAASAYRSGTYIKDERTGLMHDYTRKSGVEHAEILAPDDAPEWMRDRAQLWNAVEKVEKRKNSQLARDLTLALPHELTAEQRRDLVRQFCMEQFVSEGMIADVSIHTPHHQGDHRNHHAHVMLTMRELMADGFHKDKSTAKARSWNDSEKLEKWRTEWAAIQNREFERLGIDVRVDHRSLQAQGIDREPQIHEGPAATNQKRRDQENGKSAKNDNRQTANDNRANLAQRLLKVQAELDRIRTQQKELEAEKLADLTAEQNLSDLALRQKHDTQEIELREKLKTAYGPHLKTTQYQADTIQRRLEGDQHANSMLQKGIGQARKIWRDFSGKTRADQEHLSALRASIQDAQNRMQEQRDALAAQQKRDREAAAEMQQRRRDQLHKDIYQAQSESAESAAGGSGLSYAQRLAQQAERYREKSQELQKEMQQQKQNERKNSGPKLER